MIESAPSSVLTIVQEVVVQILRVPLETVTPEARLLEDLEVDSLFVVQLAMALEERFSIEVPEEDIPGLKTIQDLVDYVQSKAEVQ